MINFYGSSGKKLCPDKAFDNLWTYLQVSGLVLILAPLIFFMTIPGSPTGPRLGLELRQKMVQTVGLRTELEDGEIERLIPCREREQPPLAWRVGAGMWETNPRGWRRSPDQEGQRPGPIWLEERTRYWQWPAVQV